MRKLLLVSVFGLALAGAPARAQIAVTDGGNLIAQAKSLFQDLKSYATQLQQLQQQVQQVMWAANTFQSLVQNPSIGSAMALANMAGLDVSLPINPYAVQGLVGGYGGMGGIGGLTGKLGTLNGLINTSWGNDNIYSCQTNSWACQQQTARATSNAGVKGMVGQLYTDVANHLPVLQALRLRAETATTPAEREHLMTQIQLEQAWAQNAGNQLQSVVALGAVQREVRQQREEEHLSQSIEQVMAQVPKG